MAKARPLPKASISIDPHCPASATWPGSKTLKFNFFAEMQFSEAAEAEWAEQAILGRSESYLTYASTANREIPISTVFVSGQQDGPDGSEAEDYAISCANWLRACTRPNYVSRKMIPPPTIKLKIGNLFNVRGVIQGLNIEYRAPWNAIDIIPHIVGAQFSVKVTTEGRPPTYVDILNDGS